MQTLPRIVTKIVLPVIGAAISDTTLACLLHTKEVVCLWNDRHIRIKCVDSCPLLLRPNTHLRCVRGIFHTLPRTAAVFPISRFLIGDAEQIR